MGTEPAVAGVIANPAAGKDIRRLAGHAITLDNQAKVGIVRQVLVGMEALGIARVLIMPDTHRLGERALGGLGHQRDLAEVIDMPVTGQAADTERAAALMRELGARCLVVLGGDGTVCAASHGAGDVPILPISTGTNNVVPTFVEATVAGMAAGALACGAVGFEATTYRHKRLVLEIEGRPVGDALVDVSVLQGRFVGSRAIWDVSRLRQVVVTRASPSSIGLSSIVGMISPMGPEEPGGFAVIIARDAPRRVTAPVGPGLIAQLGLADIQRLQLGQSVSVADERPLVIALDGERQLTLDRPTPARVVLSGDGPRIVVVERVMEALAAKGFLVHSVIP